MILKMEKIIIRMTTFYILSAWMLFGIYKYCSSGVSYWNDLQSTCRIVGSLACNISAILSVAGIMMSSLYLIKYGKCKLVITNIIFSGMLALWLIFPVIFLYFCLN